MSVVVCDTGEDGEADDVAETGDGDEQKQDDKVKKKKKANTCCLSYLWLQVFSELF